VENALFYTFSTIAQALAGVIAFLTAVLLYKFQRIDSELSAKAPRLLESLPMNEKNYNILWEHAGNGRYVELLAELPKDVSYGAIHPILVGRMHTLLKSRTELTSALKFAVSLILGSMVAAVIVLAFIPHLKDCIWLSRLILGAGAVLFVVCLISCFNVIRALFR